MKVKKAMKKWLLPAIAVILVLSYCHIAYSNITYEYFRFRDYLRLRKEISLCSSYFLDNYENYIALLTAEIPPDCVLPSERLGISFDEPVAIDRVVMQEDISLGERVLQYKLIGFADGKEIELASGSNIGHKHIDTFVSQKVDKIKLQILQSKATPQIKSFAVYETIAE